MSLEFQDDQAKLRALRTTKAVATGALILCVAVFLTARSFSGTYPYLSYVAAFAEAAAIGGLADWYAVVALFRRPLGLPIPHTAIIPANKDRIADNLGRFIETNFLAPEPVRKKLEEVDFAKMVANWLADRKRSAELARFVGRLVAKRNVGQGQQILAHLIREGKFHFREVVLRAIAVGRITRHSHQRSQHENTTCQEGTLPYIFFHSPNVNVCIRSYEVANIGQKQRRDYQKEARRSEQQNQKAEDVCLRLFDLQYIKMLSASASQRLPTHLTRW